MINHIAKIISKKLVFKNIIDFDDYEIYVYGLELLISNILEILGLIVIAYIFNCILEMIIFIVFFSLLRVNSGGYHAKTCFSCFILISYMSLSSITAIKNIKFFNNNMVFLFLSILISGFLIIKYAPVDNPNRTFTEKEKKIYRKRSLIALFTEILVIILSILVNRDMLPYCNVAVSSMLLQALSLMIKS